MLSTRVDYDTIAEHYDRSPHRKKSPDPELVAFIAERPPGETLAVLDIACGTGNQLVANRAVAPNAFIAGIDGSLGMLRQAQHKAANIAWVHGDSAALPFAIGSFDFASCQYAFHHFRDQAGMLREAFRTLRVGGRFAMYNLSPQDMPDFIYYPYFPEAKARDLADFWPAERITMEMQSVGFADVTLKREHIRFDHALADFLETVRRRENNSQLITLSDAAYAASLSAIERDIADPGVSSIRPDHLCFVTIRGDKPV
jgi:ubiquinone/menaquinone biosynthesis C-methylase UbiE